MKDGAADTPSITAWLCANLSEGACVGVDGTVCSIAETKAWNRELSAAGILLEATTDPFATIWDNRPELPMGEVFQLPLEYCGESTHDKLARLREVLASQGADGVMLTMLDEVAWMTNMRGCDVDYNPVFVAYMLVTAAEARLFIESGKVNDAVKEYLAGEGITLAEYGDVWQALCEYDGASLLMQPNRCNRAVLENLNTACYPVFADSPVAMMKAVKNDVEIAGFKKAMLSEGIAMVKFLRFLKPAVEQGGLTEIDVDTMLTWMRGKDADFRGLSFATIAAYGANAAIVHYEPTPADNAVLQPRGFLLLDCGGQYVGGTTDITRTIPLGELTDEEREDYTRVLRGHISLAMAKFPKGTCGTQLDVLARQWLWSAGENYLHGTGHGVGHFLNVHEGPHQIRMNNMPAHLQPGMTVTNEPGLYKAGRHGIRIENTMLVKHYCESEFGTFYELEPLTLCPIDTTPVVPEILGADATAYLNAYNAMVCKTLSPYLNDEERAYLEEITRPI
jgi:Xaa-Pro aminopeptidase